MYFNINIVIIIIIIIIIITILIIFNIISDITPLRRPWPPIGSTKI